MKLIIADSYEEASLEASKILLEQIKTNPKSHLGLATGSTPLKLYEYMVADFKENGTSYKEVKSFNLDEYFGLDGAHPQSYRYFMMENLFNHVDILPENVNVPAGQGDIQENCDAYNAMLSSEGVDIQLLGIGSNGHIGFNEPGTSFDEVTHCVELEEGTREDNARLFFDGNIDEVPTHAVTMGIKNIMEAKKVLLLAFGENKAEPIRVLVEGEVSVDVPASVLQNHPDVTVIIDHAAASKLTKK